MLSHAVFHSYSGCRLKSPKARLPATHFDSVPYELSFAHPVPLRGSAPRGTCGTGGRPLPELHRIGESSLVVVISAAMSNPFGSIWGSSNDPATTQRGDHGVVQTQAELEQSLGITHEVSLEGIPGASLASAPAAKVEDVICGLPKSEEFAKEARGEPNTPPSRRDSLPSMLCSLPLPRQFHGRQGTCGIIQDHGRSSSSQCIC